MLASRQASLADLGRRALASEGLDELLTAGAEAVRSELGAEYASVLELTGDGRSLHVRAAARLPDDMLGGVLRGDAEKLSARALERDEPVVVEDFRAEPELEPSAVQPGPRRDERARHADRGGGPALRRSRCVCV